MVIQDRQGITALAVKHGEVALKVHLPQFVRSGAFEPFECCCRLAGFRFYTAVALEDVFDCALTGKLQIALVLKAAVQLSRAPGRVLDPLAQDKLFATLDPTSRALTLPDGRRIMLIDTVGFIRRLPHNLVEAFKSTLEEAVSAKLILNVCDASDPECPEHLEVTEKLLDELGCSGKPVITVLNKCDLPLSDSVPLNIKDSVRISALSGEGIDTLLEAVSKALPPSRARVKMLIPYSDGAAAAAMMPSFDSLSTRLAATARPFSRRYFTASFMSPLAA